MRTLFIAGFLFLAAASSSEAQTIPLPAGPVLFCGNQGAPPADSYEVVINGAAAEPLTISVPPDAECPANTSSSFTLPSTRFQIGNHIIVVYAINQFGRTAGPEYQVQVGIAPGQYTIEFVKVLPPGE